MTYRMGLFIKPYKHLAMNKVNAGILFWEVFQTAADNNINGCWLHDGIHAKIYQHHRIVGYDTDLTQPEAMGQWRGSDSTQSMDSCL